jgi:UDP-N-acetylglucosamine pyrophosphorylase
MAVMTSLLIFHFLMHLALKYKRLLDGMAARGVKYVDCYGVDNVLVSIFFLQFYSMELSNIL